MKKNWMILGRSDGGYLIVSPDVEEPTADNCVAIVNHEEDLGPIVHAPEMYGLLHELVTLNLLKERVGETDLYIQRSKELWAEAEQLLCDFVPLEAPEDLIDTE